MLFKRSYGESFVGKCWSLIEVPLNLLRDYSVPITDPGEWDRTRAAILVITTPFVFCFFKGDFGSGSPPRDLKDAQGQEETAHQTWIILLCLLIPQLVAAIYIRIRTRKTEPPKNLMFAYAITGFIMSIMWISFTSDMVVDLLSMLGLLFDLPKSLLGLTLLAWGNCMGDLNADVAMTKKGFGEMAITGCLAGPIFNILVGLGFSGIMTTINKPFGKGIEFSLSKYNPQSGEEEFNDNAVIPLLLILSQLVVIGLILANGIKY